MRGAPTIIAVAACGLLAACGEKSESVTTATEPATATDPATEAGDSAAEEAPQGTVAGDGGDPADAGRDPDPRAAAERAVARSVRAYLLGLDRRDGERVCELLAPGAIGQIELPKRRGGCAASLTASIGYRDPRGMPVFESLRLAGVRSLAVAGDTARARATTVTTFSDREEPSIEDDVVYLLRDGARWLIAKPSASLYRAVGIAEVPPSVLAPPG